MVERVVAERFMNHVDDHTLLRAHQSAYRRYQSTETAIAAVHNETISSLPLTLTKSRHLYISSGFDTVDHGILLSVLAIRFGIDGVALRCVVHTKSLIALLEYYKQMPTSHSSRTMHLTHRLHE
jgi:hypothetical protein